MVKEKQNRLKDQTNETENGELEYNVGPHRYNFKRQVTPTKEYPNTGRSSLRQYAHSVPKLTKPTDRCSMTSFPQ